MNLPLARTLSVAIPVVLLAATASAAITIETVPVGNPGNAGELSGVGAAGWGPDRSCGAVSYTYNVGKYEVTAGQYTAFLNSVAASDRCGLYSGYMWSIPFGCRIQQSGASGSYTYAVASDHADRPVNFVSYWDACRFSNWLHNGQPTGDQGAGTTERGAYTLDGFTGTDGRTIQRNSGSHWALTSEDEWYKAAYYDPATSSYYDFPTTSDSIDIGKAYYGMSVGHLTHSGAYVYASPYGTFDQGGNAWEWNEAIVVQESAYVYRGLRGGQFDADSTHLLASHREFQYYPSTESGDVGFRVVLLPEPASVLLLVLTGLVLPRYRSGL